MVAIFLGFISQLAGAAVGVLTGYWYIEKRTKGQQKPKQDLIEKHKEDIKQFMLFYMNPRDSRPKVSKDFEKFLNNLLEMNKTVIWNFFLHIKIVSSENDLKILFSPEYFKGNIGEEKFPKLHEVLTHYYKALVIDCFDQEIFDVIKGEPRKTIDFIEVMSKEDVDKMFEDLSQNNRG